MVFAFTSRRQRRLDLFRNRGLEDATPSARFAETLREREEMSGSRASLENISTASRVGDQYEQDAIAKHPT